MSNFGKKSDPFGRHIPVGFNMWVPQPPGIKHGYLNRAWPWIDFCVSSKSYSKEKKQGQVWIHGNSRAYTI